MQWKRNSFKYILCCFSVLVKTEKFCFNKSFRNFTAPSGEGRIGPAESSFLMRNHERKGDEEIWQLLLQNSSQALCTSLTFLGQFSDKHILWERCWSCEIMLWNNGHLNSHFMECKESFLGLQFLSLRYETSGKVHTKGKKIQQQNITDLVFSYFSSLPHLIFNSTYPAQIL